MSRAQGAAASEPKPPCSTMHTTTTSGWPAGAHDAYQEWSSRPGPDSAVPVLPATGTGYVEKTAADVPTCAASYSPCRIASTSVSFSLRCGLTWKSFVTVPRTMPAATCGVTTVPPFAIVEYATASWRGLTWSAPWPIARLIVWPSVHGKPMTLSNVLPGAGNQPGAAPVTSIGGVEPSP